VSDIVKAYNKSRTLEQIARELATSSLIAKEALDHIDKNASAVRINLHQEPPAIARGIFNRNYCAIKNAAERVN